MRPLGVAVIRAGLVDTSVISEMQRWGLPIHIVEETQVIRDADVVVRVLQDALESGEQVRLQDTDLDIVQKWVDPANQIVGKLVVKDGEKRSTSKCIFCRTLMGEFAFPWTSESLADLLVNGESHLQYSKDGEITKAYFIDVRELYIGDSKAFVVCLVSEEA